ncbi:MAG: GspE/PulE family protein [Dehalococcoidia bacterium]|jgi:general secretion pathway protein E
MINGWEEQDNKKDDGVNLSEELIYENDEVLASLTEAGSVNNSHPDDSEVIGKSINIPTIELKEYHIDESTLRLVPESIARKATLIPLSVSDDTLLLAMAFPEDVQTIRDITTKSGKRIRVVHASATEINSAINLYYRSSEAIENSLGKLDQSVSTKERDIEISAQTPVAQTLDLILAQAIHDRASDVHIEPQGKRLRIRFRIDGILHDMYSLPISAHGSLISRIKILGEMNIAEQRRSQDGQMNVNVGDKEVDIRVATMATSHGERASLRILDKSLTPLALDELGFLPEQLEKFCRTLKSPFGTILVGGPTGSGKTTSLYAALNQFNRKEQNIITVEDPIEYRFEDINQTQVNPKAGITFASGLRNILRHDPDIILIGEIRDKDTAQIATQAALTGRLVLATIHANDAISILFRLLDLGIEPYLISPTLVAVQAQRMVRRICPYCKTIVEPSADEEASYERELGEVSTEVHIGKGCNMCAKTGYRGRVALTEILIMTENLRRMLLSGASADEIKTEALKEGMITMQRDGMLKAQLGITSHSEVIRATFTMY